MKTDEIKSVIKRYVNNDNSKYAIMLNGLWGSGKTHFVKNDIFPLLETNMKKTIYVSLNGISHISQLEHKLLILLYLNSDDKKNFIKSIGKMLLNVVNHYGMKKYKVSLKTILDGANVDVLRLENKVICFDDLERCKLPIAEILGHINDYVEHRNLKAIILADETKIPCKKNEDTSENQSIEQSEDYSKIKEKVIGRTINFSSDISHTIPNIIETFIPKDSSFKDFIKKNENHITKLTEEFNIINLRTIIFFLENLEPLYITFRLYETLHKQIILSTLIFSNEFREGTLKPENYGLKNRYSERVLTDFYHEYILNKSEKITITTKDNIKTASNNPKLTEIRKAKEETNAFFLKYLQNNFRNYKYFKSIHDYIYSGDIDYTLFNKEINEIINETPSEQIQLLNDFLQTPYYSFSDSDFKKIHDKILSYAVDGIYDIYAYDRIYYYIKKLIENKLSPLSINDLQNTLINGLHISKKNIRSLDDISSNYHQFPKDDVISLEVLKIHNEFYSSFTRDKLTEFVSDMQRGNLEPFKNYIQHRDLFLYIDCTQFTKALINLPNPDLYTFTELLDKRYFDGTIKTYLILDIPNLKKIAQLLEDQNTHLHKSLPIKSQLFEALIKLINMIVTQLEDSHCTI